MRCYVDMLLITSTANIKTWERDNGLYGGLSPLARGTRLLAMAYMAIGWFIPAGAGNTGRGILLNSQTPVYPRWRGEHANGFMRHCAACGLSPLARGTHSLDPPWWNASRFIPAGAGNTEYSAGAQAEVAVYPRWRGEHNVVLERAPRRNGLSPLARGTRWGLMLELYRQRFIPAGAGNTDPARV